MSEGKMLFKKEKKLMDFWFEVDENKIDINKSKPSNNL